MRLLVCGGRDYTDRARVYRVLSAVHEKRPVSLLVSGGAQGADFLGETWAKSQGIPIHVYPAEWARYGNRAGILRNQRMLDAEEIDGVVAFPGGTGTADMVRRAEKAGIRVMKVERAR